MLIKDLTYCFYIKLVRSFDVNQNIVQIYYNEAIYYDIVIYHYKAICYDKFAKLNENLLDITLKAGQKHN